MFGRDEFRPVIDALTIGLQVLLTFIGTLTLGIGGVGVPATGERQRLGFVRALTDEPTVLLLDEPTSSLDARTAGFVEDLVKFALKAGRIVILVTHDPAQANRLSQARLMLTTQTTGVAA